MNLFHSKVLLDSWNCVIKEGFEPIDYLEEVIITGNGVYDNSGNLIEKTIHRRKHNVPVKAAAKKCSTARLTIDECLFINVFYGTHWGHFLTETLARCHSVLNQSLPTRNIVIRNFQNPFNSRLLENYFSGCKIRLLSEPLRVNKLHFANPSMTNCYEIYREHITLLQRFGDDHRENVEEEYDKVYLSRTKLTNVRKNEREIFVENELKKSGWTVIHMQELSIGQQINVLENSRVVSGCIGSQFHNLMLCRKHPEKVIYLTVDAANTNPNYAMHDTILGIDSTYIECQRLIGKKDREFFHSLEFIDFMKCI